MAIDDGPVVVGGGPSGLAAAIELRGLGISPVTVIEREREAGGIPRHSDHTGFGLRDLHTVLSARATPPAIASSPTRPAWRSSTETMVTEWEGERSLRADRAERALEDRAAGGRPRHRLPRAASFRAPRSRIAARGRDDDGDPAAARPPARPEGRQARGDSRRRARQLLRDRHARPRRRLGRGPGHRAAATPVAAELPGRGGRPLPGARLDAHQGERHPRRRARRVGGADRAGLGSTRIVECDLVSSPPIGSRTTSSR